MAAGERFDRAEGSQPYKPESRALDPREVVITEGWNVRDMTSPDTRDHIAALKISILARGVDKAISVRYDRVTGVTTLVDGQCRLTACRELWDEGTQVFVPAIRVQGDEAELTAESLTSNTGHPLTQWEIGAGCRRLLKFGWTPPMIAAHICKTLRYVTDAIALANVSIEAKAMLSAGQVTPGAVLHAVKEHGPDKATEALQEAIAAQPDAPEPPRATIPGTAKPSKAKPVARPKAESKGSLEIKTVLALADDLAAKALDDELPISEVWKAAKAYQKARGI